MFVLDDSGSMMFEIMPDDYVFWGVGASASGSITISRVNGYNGGYCYSGNCDWYGVNTGYVLWTFPRVSEVYGDEEYAAWYSSVATVQGLNLSDTSWPAFAALTRSSQANTIFYDPSITYVPWVDSQGNSFPNASTTCALHNPRKASGGCRTLNASVTTRERWANCASDSYDTNSCTRTYEERTFWPATYFYHTGGDVWDPNNYERVFIRNTVTSYSGHGRENRSDCTGGVCTYAQEIQNFANWYTYYRSRILASRAGIGRAFSQQGSNMRVGYGTINKGESTVDNQSNTRTIVKGVRPFVGDDRTEFFDLLYDRDIPALGTPLRRALDAAGQYYSRSDNRGPWGAVPGTNDTTPHLQCRRSYTVLMTDGYWSGGSDNEADTSGARQNVDNSDGPTIDPPSGSSYQYTPADPFRDGYSNTLADVAMYYWKRDLRTNLDNRVRPTAKNPAFWQHMITFGVGLGVTGSIEPEDAWAAMMSGDEIAWPNPNPDTENCTEATCSARIDDLLHASINSRGGFFSATDPNTFAEELTGVLQSIAAETKATAAALASNSTRLNTDTHIYQAKFDSADWSGQLLALKVNPDGSVDTANPVWDTSTTGKIPTHNLRKIFTWNGDEGLAFTVANWDKLTEAQRAALQSGGTVTQGQARLNWIRGDQSQEVKNGGVLRDRSTILGDIVNSDPFFVDVQNFAYDRLPDGTGGKSTYLDFRFANKDRTKMVYVGANDGMLHAFDATTGQEKFTFIPKAVFSNLASLTSQEYTHRYFVDGSPYVGEAYWDGQWRTILVGTTGAGGRSVFALDITDPDSFDGTKVLWEFSSDDDPDLGYTLGQPIIGRMKNGDWAVIFGNGYGSDSHKAFLYVLNLKPEGDRVIRKIPTGVGDASSRNGLSTPTLLDSYRTIEYAYAGDLQGNVWKFDLTHASNTSQWDVAFKSGSTPQPLFSARHVSAVETPQPITSRVELTRHPTHTGHLVIFGTGKYFEVGDNGTTAVQSLYGIWDNGTARITQTDRSVLQQQTIEAEGVLHGESSRNWRVLSNNTVNWETQKGWYLDLISPEAGQQGERVVSGPKLRLGRAQFSTLIPDTDPCVAGGTSWSLAVDVFSGGRFDHSIFDADGNGVFDTGDFVEVNGELVSVSGFESEVGIVKNWITLSAGPTDYVIGAGTDAGGGGDDGGNGGGDGNGGGIDGGEDMLGDTGAGRQSWRQMR
jgi:type IV pilus assembly protein PilY1